MIGTGRTCVPMAARNRRRPSSGWTIFAALAIVSAICVLAPGCRRSHPAMVPVRGKLTLNGGPWPKPGIISFCPVKAAEGFPTRPGSAVFDADGVFVAKTSQYYGLIPGEYRIAVICWEKPPGDNGGGGKSYIPLHFTLPGESGLELKVPPNSDTVVWDKDISTARR